MKRTLLAVFHLLADTPLQRAHEKMVDAQRAYAKYVGEVAYHDAMIEFHAGEAASLDPHTHWWEFAAAKQKHADHSDDLVAEQRGLEEARAALDARTNRYFELKREVE